MPATIGVIPAFAGTKDQLDAAKAELAKVQAELDRATARWNEAESRLDSTRGEIVDTRIRIGRLEDRVQVIEDRLNRRAVIAFTNGPASTIDLLLSSGSFTDFTDRLEFLGSMAQSDGDLIIEQEVPRRSSAGSATTCSCSRSVRRAWPRSSAASRRASTRSSGGSPIAWPS